MRHDREIGDDVYAIVNTGDGPFHTYLEKYAGYEKGYLDLADYPKKIEALLDLIGQKHREELWPVIADSPARLILHGAHYDSQTTPPHMFERYITPYFQELSELLHRHDKVLAHHADSDSSRILGHFKDAGYDMVECFTTAPLVPCTLSAARQAWGDSVIIWGGVPSIIVEEAFPEEEFEAHMMELFSTIAPGSVVTEVQALELLTGVTATHVASGGVGGSEGSVVLSLEGSDTTVRNAFELAESLKGEPPVPKPNLMPALVS